MNNGDNLDNCLTLRKLSVCNKHNFDDSVIKAGFHRLWLIFYSIDTRDI